MPLTQLNVKNKTLLGLLISLVCTGLIAWFAFDTTRQSESILAETRAQTVPVFSALAELDGMATMLGFQVKNWVGRQDELSSPADFLLVDFEFELQPLSDRLNLLSAEKSFAKPNQKIRQAMVLDLGKASALVLVLEKAKADLNALLMNSEGETSLAAIHSQIEKITAASESLGRQIKELRESAHMQFETYLANHKRERNKCLAVACIWLAGLIAILIYFSARLFSITRIILELTRFTEGVSRGEYPATKNLALQSASIPGEVKALQEAFIKMTTSIEKRDQKISEQNTLLVETEKLAAIGRISAKITHEVRNPLNSIGLNLELLADRMKEIPDATSGDVALIQSISNEVERITKISEEYLSYSRLPRYDFYDRDLNSVVAETCQVFQAEFQKSGVVFTLLTEYSGGAVPIDENRLKQALMNLLKNAITACQDSRREIWVRTKNSASGNDAIIEIEDNGIGIPTETQDKIFNAFYTTHVRGTGLGLTITKQIVEDHGGKIGFESFQGMGSKFVLTLPGT
jgi:signal transduction histidine kinase